MGQMGGLSPPFPSLTPQWDWAAFRGLPHGQAELLGGWQGEEHSKEGARFNEL